MQQSPVEPLIFMIVWTLLSGGFLAFGVVGLRNLDTVTRFFHALGSGTYGRRFADRVYTRSGIRVALIGFLVIGPVFVVIGIVMIVRILLGVS
jgi:hypothetical protein